MYNGIKYYGTIGLIVGLSLCSLLLCAQPTQLDSLKAAFCRPDAEYSALYGKLTQALNRLDSGQALQEAARLSRKRVANSLYPPYAYFVEAKVRTNKQGDEAGLRALTEIEPLIEESQNTYLQALYYRDRGMIQYRCGYAAAYTDLYHAHELFLKLDLPQPAAFTLYHAGMLLYNSRKREERTYEIFQEVLRIGRNSLTSRRVINTYVTLGLIDYERERFDAAVSHYQEAMQIAIAQNDSTWVGILSGNLAKVYQKRGEYDKALKNFMLDLRMSLKGKEWGSATLAYAAIGEVWLYHKQNLPTAKPYLDSAKVLGEQRGKQRELRIVYKHLANWHKRQGDYQTAYYYKDQELKATDSLLRHALRDEVAELEAAYTLQKKEQELSLLAKENQLQETRLQKQFWTITSGLVGLILTVLILLVLYRSNRFRMRKNQLLEEKQAEILMQNEVLRQNRDEIEAQRDKLAFKNEELNSQNFKIESSIRAAQTIQQALLPEPKDLKRLLGDYFLLEQPRDVVSGDFYWVKQADDRLIIVVADCTGHGVPGAFMTLISNNLLDRIVRIQYITEPGSILTQLNQEIFTTLRRQGAKGHLGMDAVVITLQQREGQTHIRFAGAKNKLHYILPEEKQLHTLNGDRRSIGGRRAQHTVFREQYITAPDGTLLYLGTDGYADQNNLKLEKFSSHRFHTLLLSIAHRPLHEQCFHLQETLNTFMEGTEQRDDILWLGLRVAAQNFPRAYNT